MNRFFFGNFDFEEQLRGEVQRPARLERLVLELASSWLAIADAGDRIWCPGRLPEEFLASLNQWGLPADIFVSEARLIRAGMEFVPWGWSPAAVQFGERHRLVINAPPLAIVRFANSREYSVPLEPPPADDWNYATLCHQLGEVLACIERLPATTAWVIKANWSHAARERILGRGPAISDAGIQWVKQRLARDGVVSWELWLHREAEIGIQWHIPRSEPPQLVAITELLVDARGQYTGTRLYPTFRPTSEERFSVSQEPCVAGSEGFAQGPERSATQPPSGPSAMHPEPATRPMVALFSEKGRPFSENKATLPDWAHQAAEATRPAVEDLAQRGYFGPIGIDAMRYFDPEWKWSRTRPLQDINARWTMGRLAAAWFERQGVERPMTWWHYGSAAQESDVDRGQWMATSPEQIDGLPVSHRTWLQ